MHINPLQKLEGWQPKADGVVEYLSDGVNKSPSNFEGVPEGR